MKFNQMKFQKTIVVSAFVLAILTFVYAYTFSTPFYPLTIGDAAEYLSKVDRAFYSNVQPFNRLLATLAVVFILVSLLLFLSFTQKRRRYYIFNYIAIGCYAVFGFGYGIFAFINLIDYSIKYHNINFDAVVEGIKYELDAENRRYQKIDKPTEQDIATHLQKIAGIEARITDFENNFQKDTAVFILGFILFALIMVVSILLIVNCIIKAKKLKKEDAEFAEEDARIYAAQQAHNQELEQAMNDEEAETADNADNAEAAENMEQSQPTETSDNAGDNEKEAKINYES